MWLSRWEPRGKRRPNCVAAARTPFWQELRRASARFRKCLEGNARRALAGAPVGTPQHNSGLATFAIPIRQRQRVVACVLACAATDELLDDECFARFCSERQVDATIFRRLLTRSRLLAPDLLLPYRDILTQQVQSLGLGGSACAELGELASQLAETYEELNVIYRLSTSLTLLKEPRAHLKTVGEELLSTTPVEGLAAVLQPDVLFEPGDEPVVIWCGPARAPDAELLRVYRAVAAAERNAGAALVVNNPRADARFRWAGDWLRQLMAFELATEQHVFGALLAVNHVRGEEFGSPQVQLINAVAERTAAFLENVRLYRDLEQLFMGMLHALVSSIDAKDPYTCGHSQRVAWLGRHLAGRAGLSAKESQRVYLSGLLHDIGKIGISETVLRKPGRLTPSEYAHMKRHAEIGARILEPVRRVEDIIPGVLHHHEWYDGQGYPEGLAGEGIPLLGRILGLADSFDAMTTSRTYRGAFPLQVAHDEIRRGAGTQFDPELVGRLLDEDLSDLKARMTDAGSGPPDANPCPAGLTALTC